MERVNYKGLPTTPGGQKQVFDYQLDGITVNQYQKEALGTAVYPGQGTKSGLEYTLFGLIGEAGEVANLYKKMLRSEINPVSQRAILLDELGDVAWYLMAALKELGYTGEDMAQYNLNKLAARKAKGELKDHK